MMMSKDEFLALLKASDLFEGLGWKDTPEFQVVKCQGNTDMCWAIVCTDCTSMCLFIKNGRIEFTDLSASELLNCANEKMLNSLFCYEFSMVKGYKYMASKGAVLADHYPFEAKKSICEDRTPLQEETKIMIKGYEILDADDEIGLLKALKESPFTAAIFVDKEFFKVKSEIYVPKKIPSGEELSRINSERRALKKEIKRLKLEGLPIPPEYLLRPLSGFHAITVVDCGYDEERDIRFWWIKNSYGEQWGENGFGRVIRGSSLGDEGSSLAYTMRPTLF